MRSMKAENAGSNSDLQAVFRWDAGADWHRFIRSRDEAMLHNNPDLGYVCDEQSSTCSLTNEHMLGSTAIAGLRVTSHQDAKLSNI